MSGIVFELDRFSKKLIDVGGKQYFCCSCCWTEGNVFDRHNPEQLFSTFTVGINSNVLWHSDKPDLIQYTTHQWQPFVHEEFRFCEFCTPSMAKRLFGIISECTDYSPADLLTKPDMPELVPGLGHHLTFVEYIPSALGRFFNIQVDKDVYRQMMTEKLPKSLVQFHVRGYWGW